MTEEKKFKVASVAHTSITVSSLKEALRFWVDTLGFRLISTKTSDTGKWLDEMVGVSHAKFDQAFIEAPGHTIELLEYHSPFFRKVVKPRSCDVGAFHIGLMVDDLDAAVERAERIGWRKAGKIPPAKSSQPGTRLVFIRGPDGTTVEFHESITP